MVYYYINNNRLYIVLFIELIVYYLIRNPPLFKHPLWQFEICLPSLYHLTESSRNDQITLFLPLLTHTECISPTYLLRNKRTY